MRILDVLPILVAEKVLRRTPSGMPLTEFAIESVIATLEDEKNQNQDATMCINCGFIISSLLVPEGCPSCGSKDFTDEIIKENIK